MTYLQTSPSSLCGTNILFINHRFLKPLTSKLLVLYRSTQVIGQNLFCTSTKVREVGSVSGKTHWELMIKFLLGAVNSHLFLGSNPSVHQEQSIIQVFLRRENSIE